MIDDLVRDLHLLQKADSLIGKIWLKVMARRFGLFIFAGLIAVFGLGMTNVAGFYALQVPVGPIWAAVIVAIADFVLATIVMLLARNSAPGPEIELALVVRNPLDAATHKLLIPAAISIIKGLRSKKEQA